MSLELRVILVGEGEYPSDGLLNSAALLWYVTVEFVEYAVDVVPDLCLPPPLPIRSWTWKGVCD